MSESVPENTHRTIEQVARESYGRLVAYLSVHTRDLASAEDALSDALLKALTRWPTDGVPHNPQAWLLTTARHALVDSVRHQQVVAASGPTLLLLKETSTEPAMSTEFPDERLKLLFVCAHPSIDRAMHTPLMLQTVLGLDAARIAGAFLVSPKTMGQRLVRAKTKVRDAGIRFEIPQEDELPQRLDAVLEAIYAAFGIGWDGLAGADQQGKDLAEEAIWLARVLMHLMSNEPEVRGLLALMLYCEARRAARRDSKGRYVSLSEQDPSHWSPVLNEEAERHLATAFQQRKTGRFQFEAAIQSVHAGRARGHPVEWPVIVRFYEQLVRISPALGTRTGHAAAVGEANGPEAGLAVLDAIESAGASDYQPYWAVRAHLLQALSRNAEAMNAYDRAIGLSQDPAVREFLLQKRSYHFVAPL